MKSILLVVALAAAYCSLQGCYTSDFRDPVQYPPYIGPVDYQANSDEYWRRTVQITEDKYPVQHVQMDLMTGDIFILQDLQ